MSVKAPRDTDFVVLRCVLKGAGRAWFDGIEVLLASEEGGGRFEALEPVQDTEEEAAAAVDLGQDLLSASEALRETIRSVSQSNAELLERINRVQRELAQYKADLSQVTLRPGLEPLYPWIARHPIVPRGYVEEASPE